MNPIKGNWEDSESAVICGLFLKLYFYIILLNIVYNIQYTTKLYFYYRSKDEIYKYTKWSATIHQFALYDKGEKKTHQLCFNYCMPWTQTIL